jgi:hypothetical protein
MARASHMRIAMQNNSLTTISLDNLITVIGGYHDPSGPASPNRPDAPESQHQGTLGARLGQLVNGLAAQGIKFPVPGR